MPTYNYTAFAPGAFALVGGSDVQLDPNWDAQTDGYNFAITDDDAIFGGDTEARDDGGASANEIGTDSGQTAVVTDADGNTVASGRAYLEEGWQFTDEFGNTVNVYQVEIGGVIVGHIADGPVQPGNTYTVTSFSNPADTSGTQVAYADLHSETYDQDTANTVQGTDKADTLTTGAGEDSVHGRAGNDTIGGGEGDDTIFGAEGDDNIDGGSGNDVLDGGVGDDTLRGRDGDNIISGGDGNDRIISDLTSLDTIYGGAGDDFITTSNLQQFVDGGTGNDTIIDTDLAGTSETDTLLGGDGNDTIVSNFTGTGTLATGDLIDGGAGDDSLTGGDAFDTIIGGAGNDSIDGGSGNDSLDGWTGSDFIEGGIGSDTISGGGLGAPAYTDVANGNQNAVGTTDQDYFRWLAEPGSNARIFLDDNTGGDRTGDGAADFVLVDTTNNTGTLALRGFDYGLDKVVLQEPYVGIGFSQTDRGGDQHSATATITYANGNTQRFTFEMNGAGPIVADQVFTTTQPTIAGNDTLSGGDDADIFLVEDDFGNDTITGGEGGNDNDLIDLSGVSGPVTVSYSSDEAGTITDDSGNTITFSEIESFVLTDQADTLDASGGTIGVTVDALGGDDTLTGSTGADSLGGGAGNDSIDGGDGSDTLLGGAGDDAIDGGAGDDSINSGINNDTVYGGTGNDTIVSGNTGTATELFYGEEGDDSITGGTGSDTLDGGAGNDEIDGDLGGDSIDGGSGDDTIDAGHGNDTVHGGEGSDSIDASFDFDLVYGGAGDDTIQGGTGFDTLHGGDGNDLIYEGSGGQGNGSLFGDAGNDTLYSSDGGNDTMEGGADDDLLISNSNSAGNMMSGGTGNDTVQGARGDDTISGGAGNDYLEGGTGDDTLDGGDGDDTLESNYSGSVGNTYIGGDGTDLLQIDGSAVQAFDYNIDLVAGSDQYNNTYSGIENINAGNGDDTLTGTSGSNVFDGGAGNDSIDGGAGNDTIDGGIGDDTLFGNEDNDSLSGGAGDDTFVLNAGFGIDTIVGGELDETNGDTVDTSGIATGVNITGGSGTATINSGADTATATEVENIITGAGDDTIGGWRGGYTTFSGNVTTGAGDDFISVGWATEEVNAGSGSDTVAVWTPRAGSIIDGGEGGADRDVLALETSSASSWTLTFDGDESGTMTRSGVTANFDNFEIIHLYNGANSYFSGGASTVDASLSTADLTIRSGKGSDTITTGSGNDTISTDLGSDLVYAGAGDDNIHGRTVGDTLYGGSGNDTLHGQGTQYGEDGDDFFNLTYNADNAVFYGGESAGDTLDALGTYIGPVTFIYNGNESGTINNAVTNGTNSFYEIENLILSDKNDTVDATADGAGINVDAGAGNDSVTGGSGNDYVDGGTGNDVLDGGAGDDLLLGGNDGSADSLNGGDGTDTLSGGDGNDTLDGWIGNDTITGGTGDDSIIGGDGNDTFIYVAGDGVDTISDFNFGNTGTLNDGDITNNDRVDLSAFYDDIWELTADQADDGVLNQSNSTANGGTVDYSNNDSFGGGGIVFNGATADTSFFNVENTGVVCFAAGTQINTPDGACAVEDLKPGDLIWTQDAGALPVLFTHRSVHEWDKPRHKDKPILIKKGAIDGTLPHRELKVSPQHRIVVKEPNTGEEVLVPAKALTGLRGVRQMSGCRSVEYYHVVVDRHAVIDAEGVAAESFYPGPMSLHSLPSTQRAALLPHLLRVATTQEVKGYAPARTFVKVKDARALVARGATIAAFEAMHDMWDEGIRKSA